MTSADETVKAIAHELDGRERWILSYLERQVTMPYREISGETLDHLVARGLVHVGETTQPRPCWPVRCSELGIKVSQYIRTYKMRIERQAP
jgi:hypothetical protein